MKKFLALAFVGTVSFAFSPWAMAQAQSSTQSSSTVIEERSDDDDIEAGEAERVKRTEINRVRVGQQQQPGTVPGGDAIERTEITEEEVVQSDFRNEAMGIKLHAGLVDIGEVDPRGALGLTFDVNFLRRMQTEGGKPYLGLSTGVIYSHLGTPGADFFGLNGAGGDDGTHLLQFPINAKAGYTIRDVFRPSIHAGVNVTYLSSQDDDGIIVGDGSNWEARPNVGADLEFGIGKSAVLLIRPDWTFLEDETLFTGTIGFAFPIS